MKSGAAWLASAPREETEAFLEELSEGALLALPYLFEFWALPHQLPPEGDWRSWVIMGGRGAGKTRAGAEWVRRQVEGALPLDPGRAQRVALVGETIDQVREVMVFGDSGILACSPPDRRPEWQATRARLVWPNGAVAQIYSAFNPETLRGPQFDAAWADELAKWPRAQEAWDMLQFALRLGEAPQQVVTTTPRNVGVLKALLDAPSTVMTHAPTEANRAFLADSFLAEMAARYAGTRLGRQELEGVLLEDTDGALWPGELIASAQVDEAPVLDRIVVAVDPPVTGHAGSDACGIVVAGVTMKGAPRDWCAYVLEDASVSAASPLEWAQAAVAAAERWQADRVVAEVNQGGDLVAEMLRQVDINVPYRKVHASRNKVARAEPAAALYEQGRVKHLRGLGELEDEMALMSLKGFQGKGSPDRVDALVWALFDLVIGPSGAFQRPQIRALR
ncbi:MAG: terminase family protein [Pseudomonadota bacterium]